MAVTIILSRTVESYSAEVKSEDTTLVSVEQGEMEELPSILDSEQRKSFLNLHDLLNDCFNNDNAQACQKLLGLSAIATRIEREYFHAMIVAQRDTITTHERTINNFNELHERRSVRRGAKRGAPRGQGYGMACEEPKPIKKSSSDN